MQFRFFRDYQSIRPPDRAPSRLTAASSLRWDISPTSSSSTHFQPNSIFLNQNYLNPSDFPAARLPALRLSAVQELRLRLFAAGQFQHRARSGRRLRPQSGLQLQRRTPPQSPDQRQHNSRRFDGQQPAGCQAAANAAGIAPSNPNYPASPFTVGTSTAFAPCGVLRPATPTCQPL